MNTATLGWCAAAAFVVAGQARAVDKSWNAGFGNWNTGSNWFFAGVPGPADRVFIGSTILAENAFVTLNANATVAEMTITDGMTLNTSTSRMIVTGDTSISGYNHLGNSGWPSRIDVGGSAFAYDYVTGGLTVSQEAYVQMDDGGLQVNGLLLLNDTTSLFGKGDVRLTSNAATAFLNNGHIAAGVGTLTITQAGAGRIDLDGEIADDETLSATVSMIDNSAFSHLVINGDELTDSYDEGLSIGAGCSIAINMSNGWSMGPPSTIRFFSGSSGFSSNLYGTPLTFSGAISLVGSGALGRINNPLLLQQSASAAVGAQKKLFLSGTTTVNGGQYTVGLGGQMIFEGTTTVRGGVFTTDPTRYQEKPVFFGGPTTWNGTVAFNGRGSQDGDAQVTGPTTINAYSFDIDGELGVANWTIGDHLTVNATYSDEEANSNGFDATMNIGGGAASKLTMNLSTPGDSWYASGTLNLTGVLNQPTTRIEGSPLWLLGVMNTTGAVQVDADLTLYMNSAVAFGTPVSELRVSRSTTVRDEVAFAGLGSLHNLASGGVLMLTQSTLGQTSLINDGALRVGTGAGSASVHRFTQTQTGSWQVQVGGNSPGVLHDVLRVTGAASTIDGVVGVELIDAGNGLFVPSVGETFLILDARPGITGTFDNAPISVTNTGTVVEWSFVYRPSQVFLRAERVTLRCPADFNGDGFLDFFDYDDYVNCFETGVCPLGKTADFNNDGFTDFFDYDAYVQAFEEGC